MKTKILLAAILLLTTLLASSVYSQETKDQSKKDTTRNWEVGFDLLWLINKNQLPAKSLFARHNFVTKTGKYRALRFRLGVNNSYYDSSQINGLLPNKSDIIAPFARIGHEWQVPANKQFMFFYGADANIFFYQNKFDRILTTIQPVFQYSGTFTTWELGAVGFLGFKYRPTNWLSVSTESTFAAIYRIKRDEVRDAGQGEINVNEFKMNFIPITVINLCFTLNNLKP
jgi:hypothetical protein